MHCLPVNSLTLKKPDLDEWASMCAVLGAAVAGCSYY